MAQAQIYEKLKQDHQVVRGILEEMVSSKETAPKTREELVGKLKKELLAHAHAEQHVLYEALERHQESKDIALEGEEEHQVAEHVLLELARTDSADPRWKAKATVLKELIEHHVDEEEKELFSKAQEVLGKDEAEQMGAQFEREKKQEQQQL